MKPGMFQSWGDAIGTAAMWFALAAMIWAMAWCSVQSLKVRTESQAVDKADR